LRGLGSAGARMNRALFINGARDVRVAPFNLREGREDEVLLDVASVGVCGSDLHYYKNAGIGSAVIKSPFVPGHEFGGRLCDDVEDRGLRRGQLVAVDPARSCGRCEWCRAGHSNLCPFVEFIGAPPFDGATTERIWAPKSQLVELPESFDELDAAMLEPLGVAIHAVGLAKPRMFERVGVLGCGPIGLLIVQVLKAVGAGEILACDPLPHRRATAEKFGADRVADGVAGLVEWSKGGCPLVLEATNSPFGFRDTVHAARIGGRRRRHLYFACRGRAPSLPNVAVNARRIPQPGYFTEPSVSPWTSQRLTSRPKKAMGETTIVPIASSLPQSIPVWVSS
jgi:L-iditol 2-dehydrogenase